MLVFIDESGDPGFDFNGGSSDYFAMALVVFSSKEHATDTAQALNKLRHDLHRKSEFKFAKSSDEVRLAFFKAIEHCDFSINALVVHKKTIKTRPENFYNHTLRYLLEISEIEDADIILDGKSARGLEDKTRSYLRQTGSVAMKDLRFKNSKSDILLQMADMIVGAITRVFEKEDSKYKKMIDRKIVNLLELK